MKHTTKKEVTDALKKAKELEKEKPLTDKTAKTLDSEAQRTAKKLQKLLTPSWFLRSPDKKTKRK